jgi:hypothetical protein
MSVEDDERSWIFQDIPQGAQSKLWQKCQRLSLYVTWISHGRFGVGQVVVASLP